MNRPYARSERLAGPRPAGPVGGMRGSPMSLNDLLLPCWGFAIPYPYAGWLQWALFVAIVASLCLHYRRFWGDVSGFATSYLGLFLILVLLFLIVYAQVGTAQGVQNLFWSERLVDRIASSLGATMLLGL